MSRMWRIKMEDKMLRYFISFDGLFSSCEHSHWFESIYIAVTLAVGPYSLSKDDCSWVLVSSFVDWASICLSFLSTLLWEFKLVQMLGRCAVWFSFLRNLEWPCTFMLFSDSQVKRNESAYNWPHDSIVASIEFATFVLISCGIRMLASPKETCIPY